MTAVLTRTDIPAAAHSLNGRPRTAALRSLSGAPSASVAAASPAADADAVTLTLTLTLPASTSDVEAARIADSLRSGARRLTAGREAAATVTVHSPRSFTASGSPRGAALRALPPRRAASPAAPQSSRRAGIVSPSSPARRDAETARRLLLQARAVSPSAAPTAADSALVIDLFGRRVRIDGADVDLTHKEYELLAHLARNSRRIVSREELMESVWAGAPAETGERTVDVHVRRLRAKLGRYRRLISTVRGAGYRLDTGSDVAILD
ncbi:winged helix-turn-helix domain-containing protein [Brachybacterium sp. JHP9]|uniref:Winged helix-turn-helix domain-containing protein n=1 Tax=Brachybacterium equifaecis TaxID=2910770 RepID=A0ABT0R001_9MICO|nr:winged helix-turn-helix domain-containing protein [Brachybacterium equifaecis]MCL6423191.1 winged helix-turn-helix domain-containing protein [Brachybacterium equifaecis]